MKSTFTGVVCATVSLLFAAAVMAGDACTIGANCIAQVTYDGGGTPFVYFVAPDGSAYYWANNQNAGTITSGRADRVSRGLLVK